MATSGMQAPIDRLVKTGIRTRHTPNDDGISRLHFEAPVVELLSDRCRIAEAVIIILIKRFKLQKDLSEQIEEDRSEYS